jgi:DNA-binding winged helix-turn-helix (wHTH) protein/tetratricopeptide (TPR) repeat protein
VPVIYSLPGFELDTDLFELRRDGLPVPMEPQVFSVLAYLVEHRDHVVTKNELLDNVWGDRFVSESALTTRIKAARRVVGDDGQQQRLIKTVHGRGYRFVAPVEIGAAVAPPAAPAPRPASASTGPSGAWPMVGRAQELDLLARAFRERSAGGVVLTGGAGMGKTRLAETCIELAEAARLPSARAAGHSEGRSIPLSALAHLLPADVTAGGPEGLDRATVFHRARTALATAAGDGVLLLLIDDGDQLDELSLALVGSLVQSRNVFAVVTMRTVAGPTPFDGLVRGGHLLRLPVGALPQESIETLLHRVLGGPLVADSLHQFVEAAMGNPGVLRQLVETASDAGTLLERDGVWRLSGSLAPTPSLEDLVADRLRGLDDDHRHAAELLAVAREVALDALAGIVGSGVLEDLEQRGLLRVRVSGRRADVSLAHPLFGEVLLRQLPALRGRRLRRELAEAIEAVGGRRRDDRMRLVAWRIEGGGSVDPELVLQAARLALLEGQDGIARALIRRAADDGAGPAATELLAELHFRLDEPEQVEAVLAGIELGVLDEDARVRVVRRRSGNRFYAMTDADGAIEVIDASLPRFSEPGALQKVQAHRATILAMAGRIEEALTCTEALVGVEDRTTRFEVLRARSLALAAAGRGEDALELVADAKDLHDRFEADLTRPGRSILLFNELFALTELGRLDEARAVGDRAAAEGVVGGRGSWLAFGRPRVELVAGNARAAVALSAPYALEARSLGAWGAERWVLALAGMGRLLAGDLEEGARDVDRVAALWPQDSGGGLFRGDRDRSLGWLAAADGDLARAGHELRAGAALARARGALALEAMLLHDVVRFGDAAAVVDRLVELAGQLQGDLVAVRADHAVGVVARDPARLLDAVAGFERLGSPLLAAEAAAELATIARGGGDHDGAAAATERMRRLLTRLDGPVVTPVLRSAT